MRSKLILTLAIIMGLITTYLFYSYTKKLDQQVVMNESVVEVVIASQPLKVNQKLSSDMFEYIAVPETGLHPQAIKDISEVDGKFITANIEKGEIILSHRLQDQKTEQQFVSRKVTEGYRAVSIGANFVQSVSNLIEPEDYVDVIFTEEVKNPGEQEKMFVSTQLLQKARVLAVGRRMLESVPGEEYVEYSSVTLELSPDDAVKVVNASQKGTLQFTLHSRVKPPEEVGTNGSEQPSAGN
ncbi:Flp pilus assembly protein CpaB [Calidifontibacillus oryziterrae]|uniref:Flp pilus assembly protein CpaB n=1 Tax=Calidifontibacillus oryziterrae TaxID=1191699 RepID=UPI00031BFC89|nr:Flp pilus assembly protein CpaB [Calidifontibacillus oryziterrae]